MGDREQLLALSGWFPNANLSNTSKTSEPTDAYNCIAWAVGDSNQWWEPNLLEYFWPAGARQDDSIEALKEAYQAVGFSECADDEWEESVEKIALYSFDGFNYEHAAKLIAPELWSSKLGPDIDISHTKEALEGGIYGQICCFMKRPIPS